MKTYSELITLPTFEERFNYLLIGGEVAADTFGYNRYLNQDFYHSPEWRRFRRDMIIRDQGCEMALPPNEIHSRIILHHLEPIEANDILELTSKLMDPDNVVCVSHRLHNAIHYGDLSVLEPIFHIRQPGDTKLW